MKLNPDKKVVERIMAGLAANEKKYGARYCPCFWHKDEIAKDGKCFCGLYVK